VGRSLHAPHKAPCIAESPFSRTGPPLEGWGREGNLCRKVPFPQVSSGPQEPSRIRRMAAFMSLRAPLSAERAFIFG
jgi:hypothetical protein